ncbi:hypothetical protein [Roseivivax lentus]|nr:hypothetical protein [Roseivivax lentus]
MTALLPVLFLAASPLVFWLFTGSLGAALGAVFHLGLIAAGLALIASGARIEARYRVARTARRPRVPRKLCGAAILGLAALLLAASQFSTWTMPVAFGFAGFALSLLAFGLDPMRDKGFDDPDLLARHAVERSLAESDASLTALVDRVARLDEPELTLRMEAVRSAILRLVRAHVSCPESFASFEKPLTAFISIADGEVSALENGWQQDSHRAAQRFSHRIAALTDGFEARARKRRARQDADTYAFDADLILERMRQNKAA